MPPVAWPVITRPPANEYILFSLLRSREQAAARPHRRQAAHAMGRRIPPASIAKLSEAAEKAAVISVT